MRKNSRLLLFLLWVLKDEIVTIISFPILYRLFSQLSEGGVRSMVWVLRKDGYISVEHKSRQRKIRITPKGISLIEDEYGFYAQNLHSFALLTLPEASKLATKLKSVGAVALRSGFWLINEKLFTRAGVKKFDKKLWMKLEFTNIVPDHFLSHFLQQKNTLDLEKERLDIISNKLDQLIIKISVKKKLNNRHFLNVFKLLSLIDDRFRSKNHRFIYQRQYLYSSTSQVMRKLFILARYFQT